jgi:hypothetical protein
MFAVVTLLRACGMTAQTPTKADPWAGLRFFIGTCKAKTTGGAAQAHSSGDYSFQLELRDHVMARHSGGGACKGPEDFDCQHSDRHYIYLAGNRLAWQAIYFDNEGHVIHYDVSSTKPELLSSYPIPRRLGRNSA